MKQFIWFFATAGTALLIAACGKSNDNSNATVINCPAGTSANAYGQCVNAYGQVVTSTNVTTNVQYFADNWSNQKSITILDQNAFREFLRTSMGVCDRMNYTGGTADCSQWLTGGLDIVMSVPDVNSNNNINVTFRAWPQISQYGYYSYQMPSVSNFIAGFFGIPSYATAGGYFNPMSLTSWTVSTVNNSQGFEARTYGPLYSVGNRSLIQIRVEQGKLGDNTFTFKLGYPNCVQDSSKSCSNAAGVWFAQGTLTRCQSANCSGGLW